jgi:transcriptional regulator with XRE-family HTH domain
MNGALVKSWMEKQKMRPEALAVKLNVSLSTVKNILNGKKPYRPLITLLALHMNVSEELLLGERKPEVKTGT